MPTDGYFCFYCPSIIRYTCRRLMRSQFFIRLQSTPPGPLSKKLCRIQSMKNPAKLEKSTLLKARLWRVLEWSTGSTLACCARGPRFESPCGQKFVFSRKSLGYAALGTSCTLTVVPRSTQPSTLRGAVNEYQLGLRVGGHLALTDFGPEEPQ